MACYNRAVIIDFHTHVFPPQLNQARSSYIDKDPVFASLYANPKARLATTDELIASMDADGVDVSIITNFGWTTLELCVETNNYILDSVARYPGRLVGFCAVPDAADASLAEIERCARAGARGIGELRPDTQSFNLSERNAVRPFVEVMTRHKLILLTHTSEPVGHTYPGKGKVTPDTLYPFITAFPDLKIVCAHWGGGLPFYALMPEVKQALSNVFFDTAASPFLYKPQIYSQVSQLVGADKILLGSDYPLLPQSRLIKEIRSAGLRLEAEELILGGNARILLEF